MKNILYDKKKIPWLFLMPFLFFFVAFRVVPLIYAFLLSVLQLEGISLFGGEFVGLKNYQRLISDNLFYQAAGNNTKYMLGTMITLIPLPIISAILLDSEYCKSKKIYRSILLIPSLTSLVIAGTIFRILMRDRGALNYVLSFLKIPPQRWLVNPALAIIAILIVATWRWQGINMIYFTAGLSGISKTLYEQAEIDGATLFQRFYHITLPLLRPIIIFVMTLNIIGGYKLFDEVYVLWDSGASPQRSGLTLALYLYRQGFRRLDMSYASTIGFGLAFIVLILSLIQLKVTGFFKDFD